MVCLNFMVSSYLLIVLMSSFQKVKTWRNFPMSSDVFYSFRTENSKVSSKPRCVSKKTSLYNTLPSYCFASMFWSGEKIETKPNRGVHPPGADGAASEGHAATHGVKPLAPHLVKQTRPFPKAFHGLKQPVAAKRSVWPFWIQFLVFFFFVFRNGKCWKPNNF